MRYERLRVRGRREARVPGDGAAAPPRQEPVRPHRRRPQYFFITLGGFIVVQGFGGLFIASIRIRREARPQPPNFLLF